MSFLSDYTILTEDNEAPQVFHRWSAISLLSHVVGRKVWVDWGIVGKVYPNLYVILVGEPGSKKSTAMRIARTFVERLENIQVAGDSITRETITQKMGKKDSPCQFVFEHNEKPIKYSHMSIFANEMINLINSGGNPIGMIDFFTDIWDRDRYAVETKNMGSDYIIGPYVPILGCLTPDTIRFLMSQKVVSGGMVRRCIFVTGSALNRPNAFPQITPEQEAARERIFSHLQYVQRASGPMEFTPAAKNVFQAFYDANHYRKPSIKDKVLASFLETKPELILKIACLIQLSKSPIEFALTDESVQASIALLDSVELGASTLFSSSGRNDLSPITDQIRRLIDLEPLPVNRKLIYSTFYKDAEIIELDRCIESLKLTDNFVVQSFSTSRGNLTFVSTKQKMEDYVAALAQKKANTDSPPP